MFKPEFSLSSTQGLLPDIVPDRHGGHLAADPPRNAVRHGSARQDVPADVLPGLAADVPVSGVCGLPGKVRRQRSAAQVWQAGLPAAAALPETERRPDTGPRGAARVAHRW